MDYTKMTNEELDEIIHCATLEKTTRANEVRIKCLKEIKQIITKFNENFDTLYLIDSNGNII